VTGFVLVPIDDSLDVVGPFENTDALFAFERSRRDEDGESVYGLEGFEVRTLEAPETLTP
jgi:hypothetical protein